MKFVDEYRDSHATERLAKAIADTVTRPWTLMEVCGGQTHSIVKYDLQNVLPKTVTLLHGPGCPVCVTPVQQIDRAIAIARDPDVLFCSFGDMLRVPGSQRDLLSAKAEGADVRIVYSPMDALQIARAHPDKQVVFFAIGFETTAPANAAAVFQAKREGLANLSFLVSQVVVPPAIESILRAPQCRVHGFLAAGHVCTVMGYEEYEPIAQEYGVPIVVTGFEPVDILQGILMAVRQLEQGRAQVENQYTRSVSREGNRKAREMIRNVFRIVPRTWRGIGDIPQSGLGLRIEYAAFDAEKRFPDIASRPACASPCESGSVLQGIKRPNECQAFGDPCTPENPLGATMVSSEGACAAYYHYQRERT